MNKTIDTILFDLDGTLLDSNEIIIRSYKHAYRKHLNNLEISRESIIKDIGPPLEAIFKKYTNDPKTINALYESYLNYYAAHEKEYLFAYDGVIEGLKQLKNEGYNLAIVTSKFYSSAEPSIKMFNLEQYFDVITTLDDVLNPKPAKDACLHALNQFKDWNQAIMIGDNDSDILAGKNANILTAGVEWSIKGKEFLKKANPDYMLKSMDSLFDILNNEVGGKR